MNPRNFLLMSFLCAACLLAEEKESKPFTSTFDVDKTDLANVGASKYFILKPGYRLHLEGNDKGKKVVLFCTVLNETKLIDGVETRVVEERETENGELVEVSRNYFAISKKTSDVYYFGEDVDMFKDGKVASHDGSWLSGVNGAHFGLMVPGTPKVGERFQHEVAPKVAMDRSEVVSVTEVADTPAGKFPNCVRMLESTPLETGSEHKIYAPDIGMVEDDQLKLVEVPKAN